MERKLNSIMDITAQNETWKISVRVINLWVIQRAVRINIEMILMDEKV